jgi:hypothetical protein
MKVIANTQGTTPPAPALKDNGELYKFRCHFDGMSQIAFADTYEELLNLLIPGYSELTDLEKDVIRLRYLKNVQLSLKAQIAANATEDSVTAEEYQILTADVPSGDGPDNALIWSSSTPLVLIAQDYIPYTEVAIPLSHLGDTDSSQNVIVLDAVDEQAFLASLHLVGEIFLAEPRAS